MYCPSPRLLCLSRRVINTAANLYHQLFLLKNMAFFICGEPL